MKYYLDFEFIEGFKKHLFGKKRHFIDLISVGIVCEDGREYYAISKEYNFNDADEWVKANVITTIFRHAPTYVKGISNPSNIHKYIGKLNKDIAKEIIRFIYPYDADNFGEDETNRYLLSEQPVFYGYYADYDWVLFCSLFGKMIDLPKGFPMYCRDLKQSIDEISDSIYSKTGKVPVIQNMKGYPLNTIEHNALHDARFNKRLHEFIISTKV